MLNMPTGWLQASIEHNELYSDKGISASLNRQYSEKSINVVV